MNYSTFFKVISNISSYALHEDKKPVFNLLLHSSFFGLEKIECLNVPKDKSSTNFAFNQL